VRLGMRLGRHDEWEAQMTAKRDRADDIAREIARHVDAGSSQEEISAAIRRAFTDLMVSGASPAAETFVPEARNDEELTMRDTAAIADEIRRLITNSGTKTELIAVVAHLANLFPDMTIADLSAAMQEAMAEAERQATRRQ
jgi:hypothetical protein